MGAFISLLVVKCFALFLHFIGLKGQRLLATVLSYFAFDVLRIRRRVLIKNLDIAFGSERSKQQKYATARRSIASFLMTVFEFLTSPKSFETATTHFRNSEVIDSYLAQGRGIYVLMIHMGNWELFVYKMGREKAHVTALAKDIGKGALARWVTRKRYQNGMYVIDRKAGSAKKRIFDVVKSGNAIGFVVDQRRSEGELLPLFSELTWTNVSLIQLALRVSEPIIPVLITRSEKGEHVFEFLPEFMLEKPTDLSTEETVTHNAKRMNKLVEEMIRRCPDQYFWLHNRWKK